MYDYQQVEVTPKFFEMKYYTVDRLPSHKISLDNVDAILNVACDYLKLPDDLVVDLQFVSDMEPHLCGDADIEESVAMITINRKLSKKELIATLFHEMVHIKQMIDGRLIVGEGNTPSVWDGQSYQTTYKELPWEQEAFTLEQDMMKIYEGSENGIRGSRRR